MLAPAQIPNVITVIRIVLVVPTAWFLWEMSYVDALILMSVAGASDALDGWLARRFRWTSIGSGPLPFSSAGATR